MGEKIRRVSLAILLLVFCSTLILPALAGPPLAAPIAKLIFVSLVTVIRVSPSGPRPPQSPPYQPPPRCYTFDDIISEFNRYPNDFYCDLSRQSPLAVAKLPSRPPDASPVGAATVKGKEAIPFLTFPWDKLPLQKGDIIFMRGADKYGKFFGNFSAFTHTAMVWFKPTKQTFESAKDDTANGAELRKAGIAWGNRIITFAAKRVSALSNRQIDDALNISYAYYKGKPYYPQSVKINSKNGTDYLRGWMDKNDLSSMYCSKLIWLTFMKKGVDLDTNITKSRRYSDKGTENWIGVSPDDVYGSSRLAADFYCQGRENLRRRFDTIL